MSTNLLWVALLLYGVLMFLVSPTARRFGEFFLSRGPGGRDVGLGMLVASVVITWIFAKSITNAANLAASFGAVGAIAYAGYYLSIPVAGVVIYQIRMRTGAENLAGFLTAKYGPLATLAFLLVILFRLMNEVWSNTAVVGAYFGAAGTAPYFVAAMVFAGLTLVYSLRGGLRSSIFTDAIQLALGLFLLVFVLALIVPKSGIEPLLTSGEWTLRGGVDLLLVAILQSFSYPFHDPVLTDRAFLTRPRVMLRGYLIAGAVAAAFIVLFGLTGAYASLAGLPAGQDAPLRVANAFGVAALAVMSVLMMVSAGSTLDSTLSSVSRAVVVDLGGRRSDGSEGPGPFARLARRLAGVDPVRAGRIAMVAAVILGSLPLFAGTAIIKATTVSGTMVLGLAPAFLFFLWGRARAWAFHLGFWPGVAVGVLYAAGAVPEAWGIGGGKYGALLGANLVGTIAVFGGYTIGAWLDGLAGRRRPAVAVGIVLLAILLGLFGARSARAEEPSPLRFSGQTMLRATIRVEAPERPGYEVYNVRLVGDYDAAPFTYRAELRFRQTPLRSFSPSNVWLQQAFVKWRAPVEGLSVSTGLVYNQLGLFWDSSWFGNLPYLNGHKLDPDMNLEASYRVAPSDDRPLGVDAWLQIGLAEDGLNGTFETAGKSERLTLPADLEASTDFREGPSVRLRAVPRVPIGPVEVRPGASLQRSVYDRSSTDDTGDQLVLGGELTLASGGHRLFGEVLIETVSGFTAGDLERDYALAGVDLKLRGRDTPFLPEVRAGLSWQRTTYEPEGFDENFLTARLFGRVTRQVGLTAEYVRWELEDADDPELDRFEIIVHVWY